MYCMFCGKVLTTGDRIDRCYPDCNPVKTSYDKSDEIIISKLKAERDQLKIENDRLRTALSSLYESCMRAGFEGDLSEFISGEILDAVQQALNEVTK